MLTFGGCIHRGMRVVYQRLDGLPGLGLCRNAVGETKSGGECVDGRLCSPVAVAFAAGHKHEFVWTVECFVEWSCAIEFGSDHAQRVVRNVSRRGSTTATSSCSRRTGRLGNAARFDHQTSWGDHPGEFGVTELGQQAPDISVDRFFPHGLPLLEVSADERCIDARVERCRIQSQQPTLADSSHADRNPIAKSFAKLFKQVDGGQYFLDFVTNDVPAHFKCLAVNELAMRLVRVPHVRTAGQLVTATDQHGDCHQATLGGKSPCQLHLLWQSVGHSTEHLWSPVGIRDRHDSSTDPFGFQQQAFGRHAIKHLPAHDVDRHTIRSCNGRWAFQ